MAPETGNDDVSRAMIDSIEISRTVWGVDQNELGQLEDIVARRWCQRSTTGNGSMLDICGTPELPFKCRFYQSENYVFRFRRPYCYFRLSAAVASLADTFFKLVMLVNPRLSVGISISCAIVSEL